VKLSDLTPADIRELRVLAAIELAYPVEAAAMGDRRASVILAKARAYQLRTPQVEREGSRDAN
jgi:hypothetical protein